MRVLYVLLLACSANAATHFLSFATPSHSSGALRNAHSARRCGFDHAKVYGPNDLSDDFKFRNEHLLNFSRGFGYWAWKSHIILQHLIYKAQENDLVCYMDAMYEFKRAEYANALLELTRLKKHKILAFFNKPDEGTYLEKHWSKIDAFIIMGVDPRHRETEQFWAGFVCVMRNFETITFVSQLAAYSEDERIITDSRSSLGVENSDLSENRHDQTIFSLLMKKWGAEGDHMPSGPIYNHHLRG